jgi:hypothetical protein
MTCNRRPDIVRGLVGLRPERHSRTCRLGRRSSPGCCVVTAAPSHVRLRLGVHARDRPAAPKQSADSGTTGTPVTTGPTSPRKVRRAPLLRFSRPLQHTSAASRAISEGGRPSDVSRSGVLASPSARALARTSVGETSPLRFSAVRQDECGVARSADVWSGSFDRRERVARSGSRTLACLRQAAGHAFIDRLDAISVVFDPSRGCSR